jgi:hypothetical protein
MVKIGAPPKVSWPKVYGDVVFSYHTIVCECSVTVRGKASIKKRVSEVGLDKVQEVIRFYNAWLSEDKWRNENMRFKGIDTFFAWKFDEVRQIMEHRERNKPKYKEIATDSDDSYVDPFTR